MLPTGHPAPASGPVLSDRLHDDAPVPRSEAARTSAQRAPTPAGPPPRAVLLDLLAGSWRGRAVQLAAELGIADLLADGVRSVSDLARSTDTDPGSLHRLLRALARLGVFAALDAEHFANNDLSTYLRADVPDSLAPIGQLLGAQWQQRAWGDLAYSVRTGLPAADHVLGMPLWPYFATVDPNAGAQFDQAMTALSAATDGPVAAAIDLSQASTLVDVGGGRGSFLTTLLEHNPHLDQGTLYDQPHVVAAAQASLHPRARAQAGDILDSVPAGADADTIKNVLRNWDDESCVRILSNCRDALRPDARLFAAEVVLDPAASPPFAYLLDLHMLVSLTGRERTADEFHTLFAAAGLQVIRQTATVSLFSVLEAVPTSSINSRRMS
jgi:hypothetical protein